jgi:hypothetical protein
MAVQTPKILDCSVTDCSYNSNKACHAVAITVGNGSCPMCDTYFNSSQKGGAMEITGSVGACKEFDCKFNKSLECSAPGIHVSGHMGHADCATFSRK